MSQKFVAAIWLAAAALVAASCATQDSKEGPTDHSALVQRIGLDTPALPLAVSYRELMTGMVGSASYDLFEIYGRDAPLTDKDWAKAGSAATDLAAIASLLSLRGRGKFDKQRHDDPKWRLLVSDLQKASVGVASAASKRDQKALMQYLVAVGDTCQACHAKFQDIRTAPAPDIATVQTTAQDKG